MVSDIMSGAEVILWRRVDMAPRLRGGDGKRAGVTEREENSISNVGQNPRGFDFGMG